MNQQPDRGESRRAFFAKAARAGILAALGAVAAKLTWSKAAAGESCTSNGVCNECASLSDCRQPQAMSTRQALGGR